MAADGGELGRRERVRVAGARAFSSLRVRNYRLYWIGQLISLTGTWMQTTAQAWLVLQLGGSPFTLGIVTFLQFLPVTLLSLFGGVIADRVKKRNLIICTQSMLAVQAVVIALLTSLGLIQIWHIYLLALWLGIFNALDQPARQAFPVELVGRDDVANAVALNTILFNTSRIIGPSIAGLTIALFGTATCFWLNAASFIAVIGGLVMMRPAEFHTAARRRAASTFSLLGEGLRYAWNTPSVLMLLIMMLFYGTFAYNFQTFLPLLAKFTLHLDATRYGLLYPGLSIGAVFTGLRLAYLNTSSVRTIFISGGFFVIALAALGLSQNFYLTLPVLAVIGACSIGYSASTQSRLQAIVPDELRGRVMSLYTLLFAGSTPIGSLMVGGIAEQWNVNAAIFVSAAAAALGFIAALLYRRTQSDATMRRGVVDSLGEGVAAG
jgi:MFS family permease